MQYSYSLLTTSIENNRRSLNRIQSLIIHETTVSVGIILSISYYFSYDIHGTVSHTHSRDPCMHSVDCVLNAVPEKLAGTVKQRDLAQEEQVWKPTELLCYIFWYASAQSHTPTHPQALRPTPYTHTVVHLIAPYCLLVVIFMNPSWNMISHSRRCS